MIMALIDTSIKDRITIDFVNDLTVPRLVGPGKKCAHAVGAPVNH
jgi:hypothetical protein